MGRWTAPIELLEKLAELKQSAGKGDIAETALSDLELKASEVGTLLSTLKSTRAQMPDREGRPTIVKDSPFAKLAELTAPSPPARRKRPRRKKAAT